MKLNASVNKLLKNKIVLYVVFFFAVTNVLGYLTMGNTNAVIFFALVAYLTHHFNKNMIVVLLTAMVSTNFLLSRRFREGNENMEDDEENEENEEKEGEKKEKKGKKGKKQDEEDVQAEQYMDAAATQQAAYENLEGMLGANGIEGLQKETKVLVNNQKDLMKAMEGMKPLMEQAGGLMKQFNGLKMPAGMGKK